MHNKVKDKIKTISLKKLIQTPSNFDGEKILSKEYESILIYVWLN